MAAGGSQPGKADWLAKGIFSSVEKLEITKHVHLVTVYPQIVSGFIPSRGTRWPLYYTLLGLEISKVDQWEGEQMAAGGSQPKKADWLAKGIFFQFVGT